jgi:hypothetical protein
MRLQKLRCKQHAASIVQHDGLRPQHNGLYDDGLNDDGLNIMASMMMASMTMAST